MGMMEFLGAALQVMALMVLLLVILIGGVILAVAVKACWDIWREGRK